MIGLSPGSKHSKNPGLFTLWARTLDAPGQWRSGSTFSSQAAAEKAMRGAEKPGREQVVLPSDEVPIPGK